MLVVLQCHVERSRDILVLEVSSMGKELLWPLPHATIRQRSRRSLMYSRPVAASPINRRCRLLPVGHVEGSRDILFQEVSSMGKELFLKSG